MAADSAWFTMDARDPRAPKYRCQSCSERRAWETSRARPRYVQAHPASVLIPGVKCGECDGYISPPHWERRDPTVFRPNYQ